MATATKKQSTKAGMFIGLRIEPEQVKQIDRLAKEHDPKLSRSQMLRKIIGRGMDGVARD